MPLSVDSDMVTLDSEYNGLVMTNIQLLISIGIPMLVLGVGMWMNSSAVNNLRTDMNARFASIDGRFTAMENRFTAFAETMDRMIGLINDLDKRLSIIEDRMHLR
ncbi:MAG: hypothetical protein ABSD98_13135 [Candidatus Korobacteraceae bacterium]